MKHLTKKIYKKLLNWRLKENHSYYFTVIISIIIGLAAGFTAVILKNTVFTIRNFAENILNKFNFPFVYFIFPLIGIGATVIFMYFVIREQHWGEGIPRILFVISKNQGFMKIHETFSKIIGSALTIGFGGSAGLEGPAAATGAAIGSNVSKLFNIAYRQKIILIGAATSAAISSIFHSPITGIVFSLEIIMIDLTLQSIVPILVSSITGLITSYFLTGTNFIYNVKLTDSFRMVNLPYYFIVGIIAALVSLYFSKTYLFISKIFEKKRNIAQKFLIGGTLASILIFLFPQLYGEGYEIINKSFTGDYSYIFESKIFGESPNIILALLTLVILKIIATSLTINAGGIGGVFAPLIFTGSNLGLLISLTSKNFKITSNPTTSALVATAGLISGVLHAPLTAIFLVTEITGGYQIFIPILITSTTSFVIVRAFQKNNIFSLELANKKALLTHHADKNALTLIELNKIIEKDFIKISPEENLGHLVEKIQRSHRNIFPVVDETDNFQGIVTLDRVRKIMFKPELYNKIKIKQIMEIPEQVVELSQDTNETIAEKLQKNNIFNIVVLDGTRYIGFISRANFFSAYRNLLKIFSSE